MRYEDVSTPLAELATEYDYKQPPELLVKLQELITNIMRAISEFLRQFKITLPGAAETDLVADTMQIVLIIAGVLCFALLLFLVWSRLKDLRLQANLARKGVETIETNLDSAGWEKQAAEMAQAGEWRYACRAIYLSILNRLDEASILSFAPTRSNYEYWYSLSRHPRIQADFRQLADRVELVWFGKYSASEDDFEKCKSLVTSMNEIVSSLTAHGSATASNTRGTR